MSTWPRMAFRADRRTPRAPTRRLPPGQALRVEQRASQQDDVGRAFAPRAGGCAEVLPTHTAVALLPPHTKPAQEHGWPIMHQHSSQPRAEHLFHRSKSVRLRGLVPRMLH